MGRTKPPSISGRDDTPQDVNRRRNLAKYGRRRGGNPPPDNTARPVKGDHIGVSETVLGGLLDQGVYARANRDRATEASNQGLRVGGGRFVPPQHERKAV